MKLKSNFMTLLQFAFAGLLGVFLPAMVLVHFAPLIPGLIIVAVMTAAIAGMYVGQESMKDSQQVVIESQRLLLIEKEQLIEAQAENLKTEKCGAESSRRAVNYAFSTIENKEKEIKDLKTIVELYINKGRIPKKYRSAL